MSYTVAGTKAIYVSEWEWMDLTFKVHRPIDANGVIEKLGWQFSIDGVPISKSPKNSKAAACSDIKRRFKKYGIGKDLVHKWVNEIKQQNRHTYPMIIETD